MKYITNLAFFFLPALDLDLVPLLFDALDLLDRDLVLARDFLPALDLLRDALDLLFVDLDLALVREPL